MSKRLFSDFEPVSAKAWKQKIQMDLKGADYEELIFHSNSGIDVKPFYHQDNFTEGYAPESPKTWNICERISVENADKSIQKIKHVLDKGTESLWLTIPSEEINFTKILGEINLKKTPVYLEFTFLSEKSFSKLNAFLKGKPHQVSVGIDLIGHLAKSGNWFENLENDHQKLKTILSETPFDSVLSINVALYQNAGATQVQELAYALAHANEYLNFINQNFPDYGKNFTPTFKVAIGSNYFFEIAKLKALRKLYATVSTEYGFAENCLILAFPTKRDKTLYDYNVNLLRSTTQCMSAVLGGADQVYNFRYDDFYHRENDFANRIARNQLLILKEESYFDKVANPTDGSYYIEELTHQLAEKALKTFKTIEKAGGFLKQLKAGKIQQKLKESAEKEQMAFDKGERILVGTNKFINPEDSMKDELEIDPFLQNNPRKTLIEPILERRLAEKTEKKRLEEENITP